MLAYIGYFTAALLPTYLLRIRLPFSANGSINALDILLLMFLVASFSTLARKRLFIDFYRFCLTQKIFIFPASIIVLAAIASFLANLNSSGWQDGAGIIKSIYALPVLTSVFFAYFVSVDFIKIRLVSWAYFYSSSIVAAAGIFWAIMGWKSYDGRISLVFDSPNYLAMYLSAGMIIGFSLALQIILSPETSQKTKQVFPEQKQKTLLKVKKPAVFFVLFSLLIHGITLLLTASLGSILALNILLAGTLIVFYFPRSNGRRLLVATFFLVFIFYEIAFPLNSIQEQILNKAKYSPFLNRSSLDSRLVIYRVSSKILKENWFWGIGPGNFQREYLGQQQFFLPFPQWAVPHPHNMLLYLRLETGLIGFAAFLWLLIATIQEIPRQKSGVGNTSLALLVYLLLHGAIDTPISNNGIAVLFWAVIFLIPALHYTRGERRVSGVPLNEHQ